MESFEGKNLPNPTPEETKESFAEIITASQMEEREESDKLGLSLSEYRKQRNIPYFETKDDVYKTEDISLPKKYETSGIVDFIRRWEEENKNEKVSTFDRLPIDINVENKSSVVQIERNRFLSYVLYMARIKMLSNRDYGKTHPVLGSFKDITKIVINHSRGMDMFIFDVYITTGILRREACVSFKINSNVEIILD